MSFLQKRFFIGGALLCSFFFAFSVQAKFEKFHTPHIKKDYCGAVMSVYNCKCAWHGQYCDTAGMTQSQAASYVTEAYNQWVAQRKSAAEKACKEMFGFWQGNGCLTCDAREIPTGGKCRKITDLCSDDPRVGFKNGKCFCPVGFELDSDKRCEPKCNPDDPNLFFDPEVNDCACKQGFLFDGEKCVNECGEDLNIFKNPLTQQCACKPGYELIGEAPNYECLSLCGDDPVIQYDDASKQCTCPDGYTLSGEEGDFICEESSEVEMEIIYAESKPPFIANGKDIFKFDLLIKNAKTKEGVKARFELKSGTGHKAGVFSEIIENEIGNYTVSYQVPSLLTGVNSASDYVYVFFNSEKEEKEIYKTHEIALRAGQIVTIKKEGFVPLETVLNFTSPQTEVRVFTQNEAGKKFPVHEAEVAFSEFKYEETDKSGEALIESPTKVDGLENNVQEFILELDPKFIDARVKTEREYKQLISGPHGIKSRVIRNFMEDFEELVAEAPEAEVQDIFVGMRRTGYAILHLTEGRSLANDLAKETAGSVKNMFLNIIDWLDVAKKTSEKLNEKIKLGKLDELKGKVDDAVGQKAADLLKLEKAQEKLKEKFGDFADELLVGTVNKLKGSFVQSVSKYAPSLPKNTGTKVWETVFGKMSDGDDLEARLKKISESAGKNIESAIAEALTDQYDVISKKNVKNIESMIKNKNFMQTEFEADVFVTKWSATDLRAKYLKAHEVSYNVSLIKDSMDLFNNTVGEAAKMTAAWKKVAEAIESGYKAVRTVILDTTDLYYWFSTYSEYIDASNKNIQELLGVEGKTTSQIQKSSWSFIPVAFAEETAQFDDQTNRLWEERDLLEEIQKVHVLFEEAYPDDPDVQAMSNDLNRRISDYSAKIPADFEPPKIAKDYDVNGDGEVTLADVTFVEWFLLGGIVLFIVLIFKLIGKIFRKKK